MPHFVVEHMDPEVKNVLLDIHERAFQRRSIMQANRASKSGSSPIPTSRSNKNEPSKSNASSTKQANDAKIRGKALLVIHG